MKNLTISLALTLLLLLLASCGDDNPQPKPRGYFRIDMPEKQYVTLDSMRRYSFEERFGGNDGRPRMLRFGECRQPAP